MESAYAGDIKKIKLDHPVNDPRLETAPRSTKNKRNAVPQKSPVNSNTENVTRASGVVPDIS